MVGPRVGTIPPDPPANDDRPYRERFADLTHTDRLHPAIAAVLADDDTRAAGRRRITRTRERIAQ